MTSNDEEVVKNVITLASVLANQHGDTVEAVNTATAPDQLSVQYAADHVEEFEEEYHAILDEAERDVETFGAEVETHTILSHGGLEEVFDAARAHGAGLLTAVLRYD